MSITPVCIFIPYWDLTGHCLLSGYRKEGKHGGTRLLRYALLRNGVGREIPDVGNARSGAIIQEVGLAGWLEEATKAIKQ